MINFFSVLMIITLSIGMFSLMGGAMWIVISENGKMGRAWIKYSMVPLTIGFISMLILMVLESQEWWLQNGIVK